MNQRKFTTRANVILVLVVLVVLGFAIYSAFGNTLINKTLTSNPNLEDGLVGHWTFDGPDMTSNVADVSGEGNHGKLQGQISTSTMRGIHGQALEFDGVNDYINPGSGSSIDNLVDSGDFSGTAWIHVTAHSATDGSPGWRQRIMSKRDGDGWIFAIVDDKDLNFVTVGGGGGDASYKSSSDSIVLNTWQHVAFTYHNSSQTAEIYIDGQEVVYAEQTPGSESAHTDASGNLNIGISSNFGTYQYFNGFIDDVRIYNRALSSEEVSRLYDLGATTYVNKTLTSNPNLESGLVGHWTFDGKDMSPLVEDRSGNDNDGALSGQTSTTTVPGRIGQALEFDGSDDYVLVGADASLNITDAITISAWISPEGWGSHANGLGRIVEKGNEYKLAVNKDYSGLGTNNLIFRDGDEWEVSDNSSISLDVWQHVTVINDGTTITFYVDGQSVGSDTGTHTMPDASATVGIGADDAGALYFNGQIDDVRIYNRALSADEVFRLYDLGATTYVNKTLTSNPNLESGLVGHWTFDGKDMTPRVQNRVDATNFGNISGQVSTTTAIGIMGQALELDGSDDRVALQSVPISSYPFTFSVWFKTDDASAAFRDFLSFGYTVNGNYFINIQLKDDHTTAFSIRDGNFATQNTASSPSTYNDNDWHHAVGVARAENDIELYMDGTSVDTSTTDPGGFSTLNTANIGALKRTSISNYFPGIVDDARIYNRALSATEIKRLYELGSPTKFVAPNMLPNPSDAGRSPADTHLYAVDTNQATLSMTAWTDPEGDDIEYYFERYNNVANCTGGVSANSGWFQDASPSWLTVGLSNGTTYSWRVKARDPDHPELGETGYNSCWSFSVDSGGTCPFLYVWDGEKMSFETDINGPGKLAAKSSSGYFTPNPHDYYFLIAKPEPINGSLDLRFIEQRPEVDYWDQVKLFAVDVPDGYDIYAEKPSFTTPYNSLESVMHTVGENLQAPVSAVHVQTGRDVLEKIIESDKNYLVLNEDKNIGFEYQTLELDLGDLSDDEQIKLVFDGNNMFPNTMEGVVRSKKFGPRTKLEVLNENDEWVSVSSDVLVLPRLPEFQRTFVLDISDIFITNTYKVRLTWLFKAYIDSIKIDTTSDLDVDMTELPLQSAELGYHGVSNTTKGELYEYIYGDIAERKPIPFPGKYTKYGEVSELLKEIDDKFVIYYQGDEVKLRFEVGDKPPAGMHREYLLYSYTFYKDSKIDVSHAVEPMPFTGMSNFPYDESVENYPDDPEHLQYLEEWNTRYYPVSGESAESQEAIVELFQNLYTISE